MNLEGEKTLVIGGNGQLGRALRKALPAARFVDHEEFDMTDDAAYGQMDWNQFQAIINAAAFTAVDAAESDEGRQAAWSVNASAVGKLARVAAEHSLILVHVSSDYVFDGSKSDHVEGEQLSPLGVYGQTKAAGDIAAATAPQHYIVRTSWVVGEGKNFVRTMAGLASKDIKPSVVGDQVGRLTFTADLAGAIIFLLEKNAPFGTYNFSNDGAPASWAEIAKEIFQLSGKNPSDVAAVTTAEYYQGKSGIASRPLHSSLNLSKIKELGLKIRPWGESLDEYMKESL